MGVLAVRSFICGARGSVPPLVALGCVLTALSVAAVPAVPAHAAAPRHPSDAQIDRARAQAQHRAVQAGRLAASLATASARMQALADDAEIAVERFDKARVDLQDAEARVTAARAGARRAHQQVERARDAVRTFARGSYVQGSMLGSFTALVAPGGPEDLIARLGYLDLASRRRLDVVGALVRAEVRSANADSASRAALAARRAAASTATRARAQAQYELVRSRDQLARLGTRVTAARRQLSADQRALNGMLADRRRYLAWEARQKAQRLARQKALAAHHFGPAAHPNAVLPSRGDWTPAAGKAVARAALRWLGTPYAWAGGNANGPTEGSYPDEGVRGFDCSGLALWAWAQVGVRLPHYSGYQYESGTHVPRGALMPGDLVFWSSDGSPEGIHHVAIYVGDGRVVQAPHSGDVVRVSELWSRGYVGATRPGT